jgi:hypothetical protein
MRVWGIMQVIVLVGTGLSAYWSVFPAVRAAYDEMFPAPNKMLVGGWTCVGACEPKPAIIEQDASAPAGLRFYPENDPGTPQIGSYDPDAKQVHKGIYGIVVSDGRVINWMDKKFAPQGPVWDPRTTNGTAWVRWPVQWARIGAALFVGLVVGCYLRPLWTILVRRDRPPGTGRAR